MLASAAVALLAGCGGGDEEPASEARATTAAPPAQTAQAPAPKPRTNRFNATRAFALLRHQTEVIGARPAGSEASLRLARYARARLPNGRFEDIPGHPGLRNVVGSLRGRGKKALVIGAHYDTEARPEGHLGANDGAAGTAVVLELARALARSRPKDVPPLRFVLFDGEEEPPGSTDFFRDALRGSKAYAAAHGEGTRALILLDYVGDRDLTLPREGTSDVALWSRLRAAAQRVGVGEVFPDATGASLIDDHTPFLQRGIPAIDLIDFEYPYRDSLEDTLDKVSARSLDIVGESVMDLTRRFRR
jgi:hypothetical protein